MADPTPYGVIDPKFKQLLENGAFQPDFSQPAQVLRDTFDPKDVSQPIEGVSEQALQIPARDGHPMRARIWRPTELSSKGRALFVLYHPGGFNLGVHEACEDDARRLVTQLGVVCLATDYRRAPENPFPKAVEDGFDVLQWATAHAAQIGADLLQGFVVHGSSAGGNVAAVVALLARDQKLPLTGVMLTNAFLMTAEVVPEKYVGHYKSWDQCREAPLVGRKAMDALLARYKPDRKSWLFNPVAHPKGLGGLPPVYLQVSGYDPYRDDGLIYEKILREEAGVKTKMDLYHGLPHLFWIAYADGLPEETKKSRSDFVNGAKWLLEQRGIAD